MNLSECLCQIAVDTKRPPEFLGVFLFQIGARDGTRTHNPVKGADFKSAAYTNSATRAHLVCPTRPNGRTGINLEAPTGIEPVYAVLQTAA